MIPSFNITLQSPPSPFHQQTQGFYKFVCYTNYNQPAPVPTTFACHPPGQNFSKMLPCHCSELPTLSSFILNYFLFILSPFFPKGPTSINHCSHYPDDRPEFPPCLYAAKLSSLIDSSQHYPYNLDIFTLPSKNKRLLSLFLQIIATSSFICLGT